MANFSLAGTVLLFLSACLVSAARAAEDAFMFVEGQVQGVIHGDVTQAGVEDAFLVSEYHHLMHREANATQHEPLIVMIPMSRGVPKLLQAMDTGESLTVDIGFWRLSRTGQNQNYYDVTLAGARVVAVEPLMFDNEAPDTSRLPLRVRIRFDYDQITHEYLPDQESTTLTNS